MARVHVRAPSVALTEPPADAIASDPGGRSRPPRVARPSSPAAARRRRAKRRAEEAAAGRNPSGAVRGFYEELWQRPERGHGKGPHLRLEGVALPDTVLVSSGKPTAWLFSSEREGREGAVLTRYPKNLNKLAIMERMCSARSNQLRTPWLGKRKLDIVACFLSTEAPEVVYFDTKRLERFLDGRPEYGSLQNGVLQRFMVPKGEFNEVIRCVWTPSACVAERRTNPRQLHDTRAPMHDRATTFEVNDAMTYLSLEQHVIAPGALTARLERACRRIAMHLADLRLSKIIIANQHSAGSAKLPRTRHTPFVENMTVYVKHGSNNRVWLLWCDRLDFQLTKPAAAEVAAASATGPSSASAAPGGSGPGGGTASSPAASAPALPAVPRSLPGTRGYGGGECGSTPSHERTSAVIRAVDSSCAAESSLATFRDGLFLELQREAGASELGRIPKPGDIGRARRRSVFETDAGQRAPRRTPHECSACGEERDGADVYLVAYETLARSHEKRNGLGPDESDPRQQRMVGPGTTVLGGDDGAGGVGGVDGGVADDSGGDGIDGDSSSDGFGSDSDESGQASDAVALSMEASIKAAEAAGGVDDDDDAPAASPSQPPPHLRSLSRCSTAPIGKKKGKEEQHGAREKPKPKPKQRSGNSRFTVVRGSDSKDEGSKRHARPSASCDNMAENAEAVAALRTRARADRARTIPAAIRRLHPKMSALQYRVLVFEARQQQRAEAREREREEAELKERFAALEESLQARRRRAAAGVDGGDGGASAAQHRAATAAAATARAAAERTRREAEERRQRAAASRDNFLRRTAAVCGDCLRAEHAALTRRAAGAGARRPSRMLLRQDSSQTVSHLRLAVGSGVLADDLDLAQCTLDEVERLDRELRLVYQRGRAHDTSDAERNFVAGARGEGPLRRAGSVGELTAEERERVERLTRPPGRTGGARAAARARPRKVVYARATNWFEGEAEGSTRMRGQDKPGEARRREARAPSHCARKYLIDQTTGRPGLKPRPRGWSRKTLPLPEGALPRARSRRGEGKKKSHK